MVVLSELTFSKSKISLAFASIVDETLLLLLLSSYMECVYMDVGAIQHQANVESRRANLNERVNVNKFMCWTIIQPADKKKHWLAVRLFGLNWLFSWNHEMRCSQVALISCLSVRLCFDIKYSVKFKIGNYMLFYIWTQRFSFLLKMYIGPKYRLSPWLLIIGISPEKNISVDPYNNGPPVFLRRETDNKKGKNIKIKIS